MPGSPLHGEVTIGSDNAHYRPRASTFSASQRREPVPYNAHIPALSEPLFPRRRDCPSPVRRSRVGNELIPMSWRSSGSTASTTSRIVLVGEAPPAQAPRQTPMCRTWDAIRRGWVCGVIQPQPSTPWLLARARGRLAAGTRFLHPLPVTVRNLRGETCPLISAEGRYRSG
jgi:hypothetical protein